MMFQKFKVVPQAEVIARVDKMQRNFLRQLVATGLVSEACKNCAIEERTAHLWRRESPEFAAEWDKIVHETLLPHLEQEAFKRALSGSDSLLIFLLKAYNRKVYDDKIAALQTQLKSIEVQIKDVDGKLIASTGMSTVAESRAEPATGSEKTDPVES